MANLEDVLEAQRSIEATLLKKMGDFEAQLSASAPQASVTPNSRSLSRLEEGFHNFKAEVISILSLLRQQVISLTKVIDIIETRHRRKAILVNGVPEDVKNNLCGSVCTILQDKLHLPTVIPEKVTACHRIGTLIEGKCRPVLIRFAEVSLKTAIWDKKSGLKGSSYSIAEFLTRHRQNIFLRARKRFGMQRCWTLNGNVVVRLKDGTRQRIFSEQDLAGLAEAEDEPQAVEPSARTTATAAASPEQPRRLKRTNRAKK